MEEQFRILAGSVALALEVIVVIAVAIGAGEAFWLVGRSLLGFEAGGGLRAAWLRFATWILIALEFALAADIVRTAIAPSWDDIGKLGAIAAIRTGLGFFLGRDIGEARDVTGDRPKRQSSGP
jgi:uncharacterized membrane protein